MPNYLTKPLQIFRASLTGFFHDKCLLHASSLTFYTLLSIVPILAVTLGLAKGFGLEKNLETEIYEKLSAQRQTVDLVVNFARSLLKEAQGSNIAGIGVLFLFLFVISLFWTIESSLNEIWKVKRSRSVLRIFTDYLAMMVLCPFLIVIASSLIVYVSKHWAGMMEQSTTLNQISTHLLLNLWVIPLLLIWTLFASIYIIMPNTKVRLKYALPAAMIAGTLYYLALLAIVKFQIGVSQYSAIYGSFAALPLFLFLLQVSWILVMFGGEIAYNAEHLSPSLISYHPREEVSPQQLGLGLLSLIVQAFKEGRQCWTLKKFSEHFAISEADIIKTLAPLAEHGLVREIKSDNSSTLYQPGKDLSLVKIYSVLRTINPAATETISIQKRKEMETVIQQLETFELHIQSLASNIRIDQL